MKIKKILRAVAALSIVAVMAGGSLSLFACSVHKHTFGGAWLSDGENGHYRLCTVCNEHSATEKHDNSADATVKCTKCGWKTNPPQSGEEEKPDKPNQGGEEEPPESSDKPSVIKPDEVFSGADITETVIENTVLIENAVKVVGGGMEYCSLTKTIKYPALTGGSAEISGCLRLSAGATRLEVSLTADATVLVYASGYNSTTDGRLALYGAADDNRSDFIPGTEQNIGLGGDSDIGVAAFEIKGGETRYIGLSAAEHANIFYILISYKSLGDEVITEVPAKVPTCTAAGNDKYYATNYGRYFAADGTTAKAAFEVTGTRAPTGHKYNLFTVDVKPDKTTVGGAVIKCANDEKHTVRVSLPELTSGEYLRSGNSGTVTYTYKNKNPEIDITFAAQYYSDAKFDYETFNVSELATESSNFADKTYFAGSVMTVAAVSTQNKTAAANSTAKSTAVKVSAFGGLSAISPDETALNFGKGILPSGDGGVFTVKNISENEISVTVYYTTCTKMFNITENVSGGNVAAEDRTCYIIDGGAEVRAESFGQEIVNAAVRRVTITLAANQTCTLYAQGTSPAVRLILYGVVAGYAKTNV